MSELVSECESGLVSECVSECVSEQVSAAVQCVGIHARLVRVRARTL